jgi:hypothetical protein
MRSRLLRQVLASALLCTTGVAQEATERVLVNAADAGEEFEEPGGYGQPQWAERSRASSTTKLYVLSPYEVFAGILSESDFLRRGKTRADLTQEIELGLPHRFEIGVENRLGLAGSRASESGLNIGARYAFAAWSQWPLNPAISAEYQFGAGQDLANRFDRKTNRAQPDAYELRLLLGQEFVPRVQWAANLFFQHDLGAARDRELGFTQDIAYLAIADKLEFGVEMRYTNATRRRERSANEFVLGPSVSWKPNLHTVLSLAPLLGCTADSPRVAALFSVSLEFGGGESKTAAPGAAHTH